MPKGTSFIQDTQPGMTANEKNSQLSAKLSISPYNDMEIIQIDRVEKTPTGWSITYRNQ